MCLITYLHPDTLLADADADAYSGDFPCVMVSGGYPIASHCENTHDQTL